MPLYSTFFKPRKRKTHRCVHDPLDTVRVLSILEDLALRIKDSTLGESSKEKLENELEWMMRDRNRTLFTSGINWQVMMEAVREANIRDHVVR